MKQQIKIGIADRIYSLNIEANQEEGIRKAVRMINDSVNFYKERFSKRDNQDALSMTILHFATMLVNIENKDEVGGIIKELKLLDKQLEEYIQQSPTVRQ